MLELPLLDPDVQPIALRARRQVRDQQGQLRGAMTKLRLLDDPDVQKIIQPPRRPGEAGGVQARLDPAVVVDERQEHLLAQAVDGPLRGLRVVGEQTAQQTARGDQAVQQGGIQDGHTQAASCPVAKQSVLEHRLVARQLAPHPGDGLARRDLRRPLAAEEDQREVRIDDQRNIEVAEAEQRGDLGRPAGPERSHVGGVVLVAAPGHAEVELEVVRPQVPVVSQQLPPVDATGSDVVTQDEGRQVPEAAQAAPQPMQTSKPRHDGVVWAGIRAQRADRGVGLQSAPVERRHTRYCRQPEAFGTK